MAPCDPATPPRVIWRQHDFNRDRPADALRTLLHTLGRARPSALLVIETLAHNLLASSTPHAVDVTAAYPDTGRAIAFERTPSMGRWRSPEGHRPTPGWKPRSRAAQAFVNPRPPAVPATLDLNLEEYYAGAALIGIVAAQDEEPDVDWLKDRAFEMGERMAAEARRRRKKK